MISLPSNGRLRWAVVAVALLTVIGLVVAGVLWASPGPDELEKPSTTFVEVSEERGFVYGANNYQQGGNSRAGVYVTDYTNNGYPDILATGGDNVVLFENTGGEYEPSGALPEINATISSALAFDKHGDGWEDIMLFPRRGSPIFLENNEGTFERKDVGLDELQLAVPVAASAADFNHNGCLDVFVAQNGNWRLDIPEKELLAQEEEGFTRITDPEVAADRRESANHDALENVPPPSTWAPHEDNGNPNYLLVGDCEAGTFTDATEDVGIDGTRWSMATSFYDFTGNGYPDIHEANDFNYDFLWVNQGNESFERQLIPDTNRHAMSSETADFTGNGQPDIFVTNIKTEDGAAKRGLVMIDNSGNNLLVNDHGTFTSLEDEFGVRDGGWGWAAASVDFTNNGQFDLVHTTLHGGDSSRLELTHPRVWERNGDTFEVADPEAHGFEPMSGRGIAVLDYNRNGQQDLVVSSLDGDFRLYENQGNTNNWLQLSVRDSEGAYALGSKVTVQFDDGNTDRTHHLFTKSRTDLLAQNTRVHHVGLSEAERVTMKIRYPDGKTQVFDSIHVNQRIAVYPDGTIEPEPAGG